MSEETNPFGNLSMNDLQNEVVTIGEDGSIKEDTSGTEEEETQEDEDKIDISKFVTEETEEKEETEEGSEEEGLKKELDEFKEADAEGSTEESSEEDSTEESTEESSTEESPYNKLANALRDEGVLSDIDEEKLKEIKDARSFVDTVSEQIEKSKNNYIESLDSDLQEVADAIEKGVPLDEYSRKKHEEKEYSNIDTEKLKEDEDLQKKVLKEDLTSRGYSEERADKFIEKFEDTGDLEEEALTSLDTIKEEKQKEIEELKKKQEQERERIMEENKKYMEKLKENVYNKDEIVPGLEANETIKNKVFESMTTPVDKDSQGNPLDTVMKSWMEDPDYAVKLHYLHNITNGFKDFSKIMNTAKSDAVKDLEKTVSKGQSGKTGKPASTKSSSKTKENWQKVLSRFGD